MPTNTQSDVEREGKKVRREKILEIVKTGERQKG